MGFLSRLLGKKPADDAPPPAESAPLESQVVAVPTSAPEPAPASGRPLSVRNQALKDRIARARASRPPRAEPTDAVSLVGEEPPAQPNAASEQPEAVAESSTQADESSQATEASSAQASERSEAPSTEAAPPKKRRKRKRKAAKKKRGASAS